MESQSMQTKDEVVNWDDQYQLPSYKHWPMTLVSGKGAQVFDDQGRAYLDFYGGHAVMLLGHGHPAVVKAITDQVQAFAFFSNVVYEPQRSKAVKALVDFAPDHLSHVLMLNSGAESNDTALRLVRRLTGRTKILSFEGGFHGRTLFAQSVNGNEKYRELFHPKVEACHVLPFGDLNAFKQALDDDTAAVILEPIQSMAGARVFPDDVLAEISQLCQQNGTLLISDEVQTAPGRTGTPTYECPGFKPDMITSAKALAGGLPVGVLWSTPAIAQEIFPGLVGTTFGAGPVVSAAVSATLEVLQSGLMTQAPKIETWVKKHMTHPQITCIHGKGALLGLQLDQKVGSLITDLRGQGFLVGGADDPQVIRLMPPLVITEDDVMALAQALSKALEKN